MAAAEVVATRFDDALLQYGAVGTMAVIFGYVALRLYGQLQASTRATTERLEAAHTAELARLESTHREAMTRADAALKEAVDRADRLEDELREVNKLVTDKVTVELVRASDVVRRALDATERR